MEDKKKLGKIDIWGVVTRDFLVLLLISCQPVYCQLSNKGKNTKKQDKSVIKIFDD